MGLLQLSRVKYGKVDDIRGIDFSLPQDHPQTLQVLNNDATVPFELFAGGTMWNIPAWKGKVFPQKTPAKAMIGEYCRQFGTIELNATHYKIHPPETTSRWASEAPERFRFCAKFPQLISHFRRFKNCEGLTDEFINAILAFGKKRGPSFIQLPPNFGPKHAPQLIDYLKKWPLELELAIEFRHPEWFSGEPPAEDVWQLLGERGIGAVISDTAGRRDAVHMRCTAPFLVLRFGGYDLDPSDTRRLTDWVDRLQNWKARGLQHAYLLVHQADSITTPETCILFGKLAKEKLGVDIHTPELITDQRLF